MLTRAKEGEMGGGGDRGKKVARCGIEEGRGVGGDLEKDAIREGINSIGDGMGENAIKK